MRIAGFVASTLLLACLASLHAQQAGMQNEWDIHKTLTAIAVHADRVVPFVDQIHPEQWVSSGAPDAYIIQAEACRDEVKGVVASARAHSQNPEKLTDTLQLLFRIRTLEMM